MTEYQRILLTSVSYFIFLCFLIYLLLFMILPKPLTATATVAEPLPTVTPTSHGTPSDWKYLRKKILKIQGHHCLNCGKRHERMHVDHIKPKSRFPHLEFKIDNLQVLCQDCNREKSFDKEVDYRRSHHLMALLREAKSNKLIRRKYVHSLSSLERLTITRFQQDLRKKT